MKLKKLAIVSHRSAAVGTNPEMSVLTMSKKVVFFPCFHNLYEFQKIQSVT